MKQTKRGQSAVLALSVLALTLIALWGCGQDPDPLTELRRSQPDGRPSSEGIHIHLVLDSTRLSIVGAGGPASVSTSTVNRSQAARPSPCVRRARSGPVQSRGRAGSA